VANFTSSIGQISSAQFLEYVVAIEQILEKLTPVADPIKLFFFTNNEFFHFFAAKLRHFHQ